MTNMSMKMYKTIRDVIIVSRNYKEIDWSYRAFMEIASRSFLVFRERFFESRDWLIM